MYRESSISKRNRTIQQKTFGNLRDKLEVVLRDINEPYVWDRLLLDVIKNHSKAPKKFKLSQIDIILTEFKNIPIEKTDEDYLWMLYDIATVKQWQGRYGAEAFFMNYAYSKLLGIVEKKLHEIAHPDQGAMSRTSKSAQLELTF